ncbi:uncharacterized protein [Dermacentor albipictus]|uniref:uncharacterized protein n=1 Tax=Dermacentor albipictus TaxID=60249 RepID=UPI0038FC7917
MATYQEPYYQDYQPNQPNAATDPGYYDNTAFQEGVADAQFQENYSAVYGNPMYGEGAVAAPPPTPADIGVGSSGAEKQYPPQSTCMEWTTIGLMLFLTITCIAAAVVLLVSTTADDYSTTSTDEDNETTGIELKIPTMVRGVFAAPP